jgi:hypothetical protein
MYDRIRIAIEKLAQELAANKKKAAILGVLVLVLIITIGRVFLSRGEPAVVDAALPAVSPAAPADPTVPQVRPVPQPLQPVAEASNAARPVGAHPAAPAANPAAARRDPQADVRPARRVSVSELPRTPARDIFTTSSWSEFPRDGASSPEGENGTAVEPAGPSLWEQMRGALTEQREHRGKELNQITEELAQLKLQSTMNGPIPAAYISGRLVHEGDKISGFSVVRIEEKHVKLRKNGITRSLIMP